VRGHPLVVGEPPNSSRKFSASSPRVGRRGNRLGTTGGTRTPRDDLLVGLPGRVNCRHVATRTPGTRRIQEDIQLGRGAYFVCA